MNSGKTRRSRPSDQASPRRDLQKQAQTRARALAQAESFRLSETSSRPSERGSPKRGRVGVWGMRRGSSFWVRDMLAQASSGSLKREFASLAGFPWWQSRLSETLWLERDWHETSLYNYIFHVYGPLIVCLAWYTLSWVWIVWIEWPCMNKMGLWFMSLNMRWAWCLYGVIHGIKMMGLVWIWHETWVKVD